MSNLSELLSLASQRAQKLDLPYSGALTPKEAYQVWQQAPGAKLVDVRCQAELFWVGQIPDAIEIEWMQWPSKQANPNFVQQLQKQVNPESLVLFLCKVGIRSHQAASVAHQLGYNTVYNILEGFEGEKDAYNQRGNISGWRKAGLPWVQS